jgi:type II secretory pathway component PulK
MTRSASGTGRGSRPAGPMGGDRGVALLIVLLVTALLMALIVEFAYGTRISLRSAVNYRNRERAYFIARSGVNAIGTLLSDNLKKNKLQDNLEQKEWQPVPYIAGNDTELRVRWDDESGKINISTVFKGNDAYKRLEKIFEILAISQDSLDRMVENKKNYYLLTELHQVLSDEEFKKLKDHVTVSSVTKVDINTASSEVLQSLGLTAGMAGMIVEKRATEPFTSQTAVNDFLGPENAIIAGQLSITSNVFRISSFATVGGYTKQVEAVVTRSADTYNPFKISYWRAL